MTVNPPQPPLMGFAWNEASHNAILDRGLLTIIESDLSGQPHVIGTGFVVSRQDTKAVCMSAAHVFSEVRNLQSGPPKHCPSALQEFLPEKKSVNLAANSLVAVLIEGTRVEAVAIEGLVFDEGLDIALFSVALQHRQDEPFFSHEYPLDDVIPEVGALVCVLSYGQQGIEDYTSDGRQVLSFTTKRSPVLRVGRVLTHYPHGHRLCRGPCVETSIPVYSGMSGGPAIHYVENGPMRVFGLVCSDPDLDDERKQDRSIEGRSIIALLPCEVTRDDAGRRIVSVELKRGHLAGAVHLPQENR